MPKLKNFVTNLILLLTTGLVCVATAEGICRIFFPDQRLQYVNDNQLLSRFAPSQNGILYLADGNPTSNIRINEFGLRSAPLSETAEHRVLFLGDSFTFGWGVEEHEAFTSRIDTALGSNISAINAGNPGYGIYQMETLLERLNPVVRPKTIVLVIWQGSLLRRPLANNEKQQFLEKRAKFRKLKSLSVFGTHLYRKYERLMLQYGRKDLVVSIGSKDQKNMDLNQQFKEALDADEPRLLRMQEMAQKVGAKFAIVFWPRTGFAQAKDPSISYTLASRLANFSNQHGIEFISLGSIFEKAPRKKLLIPIDWHPTPYAHCLAANGMLVLMKNLSYDGATLPCEAEL